MTSAHDLNFILPLERHELSFIGPMSHAHAPGGAATRYEMDKLSITNSMSHTHII